MTAFKRGDYVTSPKYLGCLFRVLFPGEPQLNKVIVSNTANFDHSEGKPLFDDWFDIDVGHLEPANGMLVLARMANDPESTTDVGTEQDNDYKH